MDPDPTRPATAPLTPEELLAGPAPLPTGLEAVHEGPDPAPGATAAGPPRRRAPDLLALVAGLLAVAVGGSAVAGSTGWLADVGTRWWFAGIAVVVGLALVLGSLRRRD